MFRYTVVSNSNGVNSNHPFSHYKNQGDIVSNSNGVNSNKSKEYFASLAGVFQTPTEQILIIILDAFFEIWKGRFKLQRSKF